MFDGELKDVDLAHVLFQLGQGAATGGLHLSRPDGARAVVFLRSGLVYAIAIASDGAPVPPGLPAQRATLAARLATLLAWPDGSWRLRLNERTGTDTEPAVPVTDLLAELGRPVTGRPDLRGPAPAAPGDTDAPLDDDVARSTARAAAVLSSHWRPVDAALLAALASELTEISLHVDDSGDLPHRELPTGQPVGDAQVGDEPVDEPAAPERQPSSWEAETPRARPDTDLAALLRELSSLGVDDEPATAARPAGALMSTAAAHRRRGGPFSRRR